MNQILQRQNEEQFLELLAAQRHLYDKEKRGMTIWVVVSIVIAILATGAFATFGVTPALSTLLVALILLGEFLVLPALRKYRQQAALIQEKFDCELLEQRWNDALGHKPAEEVIQEAVIQFRKSRKPQAWEDLKDWYETPKEEHPLYRARIDCQMENVSWDRAQRRRLSLSVLIVVLLLVILPLIFVAIFAQGLTVQTYLGQMLTLLLPVLYFGFRHFDNHRKAADRLDQLRVFVDDLKQRAAQSNADAALITQGARDLQTEIYHHRIDNEPVYSWFYNLYRDGYQNILKRMGRRS
jgi:fatty acid desaturase